LEGALSFLGELWTGTDIRMNEGGCDPDGRFYCGSMAYDERPGAGKLYRLDPDGSVHIVAEGMTISNGIEWSRTAESRITTTPIRTEPTSSTTTGGRVQ
jgi:sugar lactone lactonase YvrE